MTVAAVKTVSSTTTSTILHAPAASLARGSHGPAVHQLQQALVKFGCLSAARSGRRCCATLWRPSSSVPHGAWSFGCDTVELSSRMLS